MSKFFKYVVLGRSWYREPKYAHSLLDFNALLVFGFLWAEEATYKYSGYHQTMWLCCDSKRLKLKAISSTAATVGLVFTV